MSDMPDETIVYKTPDRTLKAILKHSDHNDFYASLLEYYNGKGYLTMRQAEALAKDSCFQCNPPRGRGAYPEYDSEEPGFWSYGDD